MPQYIGFSTQNADRPPTRNAQYGAFQGVGGTVNPVNTGRKFECTDVQLVLTDFVNALNIRQGEKVGKPSYGTRLWDLVFQPNSNNLQTDVQVEINRIASQDPRINIQSVNTYPQDNGILVQLQVSVVPYVQSIVLSVLFDSTTNTATVQS